MNIRQIESVMAILKKYTLGNSAASKRIAEIDKKIEYYKKHAQREGTAKKGSFDSALENKKILNDIFVFLGDTIALAVTKLDKDSIEELSADLSKIFKAGETDSNSYLDNIFLMEILKILFENAKVKQSKFGHAQLDAESLRKVRIFMQSGHLEEASTQLQKLKKIPQSPQINSLIQLLDKSLQYAQSNNKIVKNNVVLIKSSLHAENNQLKKMHQVLNEMRKFNVMEKYRSKELLPNPMDPRTYDKHAPSWMKEIPYKVMLASVDYVIDLAQFHPDNTCRKLAKYELRKWYQDDDIRPFVNAPIEDFFHSIGEKVLPEEKNQSKAEFVETHRRKP